MRLSIRTKQVLAVTLVVGLVAAALTAWFISALVGVWLNETSKRAELLANIIGQRAFAAVAAGTDPYALQQDPGLRSLLVSSQLDDRVLYSAIVDVNRTIIAHYDTASVGRRLTEPSGEGDLATLVAAGPVEKYRALYQGGVRTYEVRIPLLLADAGTPGDLREFGSVIIGVSTAFLRQDIGDAMRAPVYTALGAVAVAVLVSMLLARLLLRPIHVIRSGLARLGRGELDVDDVELPKDEDLSDIGDSLKAVSARLAADQSQLAGQRATLASVVEHLEDAVAIFAPDGTLLFANAAMSQTLGGATSGTVADLLPADHPYRLAVEQAMASSTTPDSQTVSVPDGGERLIITAHIEDSDHGALGVMLVSRNLEYLTQVQTTLSYSRKLAALGRLSSGIAHEVKNPLNATMIHLELLRSQLRDHPDAMEHVSVITAQMRRLDEVVQGFLKFTRPEDLRLRPVTLLVVLERAMPVIEAEAEQHHIDLDVDCPANLEVNADDGLLEQAFLNLALNACQAMADGGRLRIAARARPDRRVEVRFEDTGVGIPPESLARVFDLYYTTKTHGSGIGLSLVYRTVQLHDGDIEVESVPGRGTTFTILLHRAPEKATPREAAAS